MHQRSSNISAKPASGPECSVPATGWPGTKWTPAGSDGCRSRMTAALDRADIGDDGARRQRRADAAGRSRHRPKRRADDDEIGAAPPPRRDRAVTRSARPRPQRRIERRLAARAGDDRRRRACRGCSTRASDEPMRPMPMSATRAKTASLMARRRNSPQRRDHRAHLVLGADGDAEMLGQARRRPSCASRMPRDCRKAKAAPASLRRCRKAHQHEIGDAGRGARDRARSARRSSHGRQSRCARARASTRGDVLERGERPPPAPRG